MSDAQNCHYGLFTIDVVSDVVCPWCFIGKNGRLEKALALKPQHSGAGGVFTPISSIPGCRARA